LFAFFAFLFSCAMSSAADMDTQTRTEIAHLFDQMQQSNCEFARNGSWYSADEAVQHIDKKYQYLLERTAIQSTESFIYKAASRSSISGQPYRVKCGTSAPVESAQWFRMRLQVFRKRNEL
jgi:hypothetical protein